MHVYLSQHPGVFMSKVKEPHHFGSDLERRWRPFEDRARYLELFDSARTGQMAGESSVLYLYSRAAPREIQALSPSAKIIIMLRNPVEMVPSLHAHNLLLLYEDLGSIEEALAAEDDRTAGRRIPTTCVLPLALQYTTLGRYADHLRRYQEAFGPDHVKCILAEDLKSGPERVYAETLAFLGLDPAHSPDFKAHNEQQRWRSRRAAKAAVGPYRLGQRLGWRLPTKFLRTSVLALLGLLFYVPLRVNLTRATPRPLSPDLRDALRERFRDDVEHLATLLGRDLSGWLRPE